MKTKEEILIATLDIDMPFSFVQGDKILVEDALNAMQEYADQQSKEFAEWDMRRMEKLLNTVFSKNKVLSDDEIKDRAEKLLTKFKESNQPKPETK